MINSTGRIIVIENHQGWGNNIFWKDWNKRTLAGWMPQKPVVGDEIRNRLTKGIGRFLVISVEYCGDPPDMFFCIVEDIGYL